MKRNLYYKVFRDLFYYLFNKFSELDIPKGTGEFSLITKNVKEIIVNINDQTPFYEECLARLGCQQVMLSLTGIKENLESLKQILYKILTLQ